VKVRMMVSSICLSTQEIQRQRMSTVDGVSL